jgi:PTS system fructose-specific IIA component
LISDSAGFLAEMVDQERRRSTRLPNGVALPYVRSAHVKVPSVAVATLTPSAWRIADAGDIELVVLLATPADASDDHLPNWERLAIRATQPTFRLACASSDSDEELERLVAGYVG